MSLPPGGYYQLARSCSAEIERKKSRFIARLAPAHSREAADAVRGEMATLYPDCRHLCFSYVLGPPAKPHATAAYDAGEPGGTAGRPMLNALLNQELGDVVAVVARYFGGTKLGAPGLARAYAAAVNATLDNAELVVCEPHEELTLRAEYPVWDRVQRILGEHEVCITGVAYGTDVVAEVAVPARTLGAFRAALGAIDHRIVLSI